MADASDFQKAFLREQEKLRRDIRPMIAKAGHYNPANDVPYEYQRYPLMVKVGDKEIKVYSKEEENMALGIRAEPAKKVDVDIANIQQPDKVAVRRGRPPKIKPLDLPADLK